MLFIDCYSSPLGRISLASDGDNLTGLWFEGQQHFPDLSESEERPLPVFDEARKWLDIYFSGREPEFIPPVKLSGTDFQIKIWDILKTIPYGETLTYGRIAHMTGNDKMSAQAVGNAVARNPVSIIIPCHRVVGANNKLTGYAGGTDKKKYLLELEKGL